MAENHWLACLPPVITFQRNESLYDVDQKAHIISVLTDHSIQLEPFLFALPAGLVLVGPSLLIATYSNIELWLPIKDCEGYYDISNLGKILNMDPILSFF